MPSPYSGFVPEPGSSKSTALDTETYIGGAIGSTPNIFQDSVSGSDTSDYYKFRIGGSSASVVTLRLDGLTGDANLQLFDNTSSSPIQSTNLSGTASELLTRSLNPGIYYVRVGSVGGASTSYNLSLSANVIPADNGSGELTTTALNIGTLNSGVSYNYTDYVGNRGVILDTNDYYQFDVGSNGTLNLTLDGLGGNANVELYKSDGTTRIARSTQPDTNSESIIQGLTTGTYYIRVLPGGNGATNYTLNLTFNGDPADNAGNTLGTARDINTLTSTPSNYSDFVNDVDPDDYYRFDLSSSALVNLTLTPDTQNANVILLNSSGGLITSSTQTGIVQDSINRSLNAGTYYIRVVPEAGNATNYNLSVSATTIGADIAPNTRGTAKNIGTINTSQSFNDFVGDIDINDYYVFNLTNNAKFNLALTGLSADANVQLLNSAGSQIALSTNGANNDENIDVSLGAGTYYIRVYPSQGNTFYNLSVSAEIQPQMIDVISGSGSSDPNNLTAVGNTLYFTAKDASNSIQLWKSDGTIVGTTRITNVNPGSFNPFNLTAFGNKLFFTADDGTNGRELWVSNGTTAQMVFNINGSGSANPENLTVVGNKLFFSADNGINGRELWVYDDTKGTVSLVKDIYSGTEGSKLASLTAFNGKLYFAANNGTNGIELWSSDGTEAGTTLVKDIREGGFSSSPAELTVAGNTLYFRANNGTNGAELWKSDGTEAGTSIVKDITSGTAGLGPAQLIAVDNTLFFVTDSNNDFQQELWKSDGTNAGTVRVKNNLGEPPNLGTGPINLAAIGDYLVFTTPDPQTGLELWLSDGSDAGTYLVSDIWAGSDPNSSIPGSFVLFNDSLYFVASEPTNGRELWKLDSPTSVPNRVSNINSGAGNANPGKLTVVGNRLFFTATNGTDGTELWVI